MRPTAVLAPIGPPVLGVPAVLYGALPTWCLFALLGVSLLLMATHVVVTQIVRLRASARITRSQDALRVLEIEDLPHPHPPRRQPGPPATRRTSAPCGQLARHSLFQPGAPERGRPAAP
jgi:hypothetical protein